MHTCTHDVTRTQGQCKMFDAIALQSVQSTPGLAYLKEGKGFTAPTVFDEDLSEPFAFPHGYAGRCVSKNGAPLCKTFREDDPSTHPPMSGVRDLADGESWCDSLASWNGRVLQVKKAEELCYAPPTPREACTDLGQAWCVYEKRSICVTPPHHLTTCIYASHIDSYKAYIANNT